MTGPTAFDLLVVGLGPAGAAAAEAAAQAGLRVLAVDRRAVPGLPVQCAEFVPMMLGADLAAVGAARVQDIGAMETYLGAEPSTRTPDFNGYMIDRARFDRALVAAAQTAGAQCRFGLAVRTIGRDGAVTLSDGSVLLAPLVIGADGPRSVVGRALGRINTELVETRQISVDLLHAHAATDIFLRPGIIGGYGWLFPRGTQANIGLGVVPGAKRTLKPLLADLHAALVVAGRVGARILRITGGAIPVGGIVGPVGVGPVGVGPVGRLGKVTFLLAGDAAGLTNPVTGAGINAAVLSGRMAGRAAAGLAGGDAMAAESYAEELDDLFGPSLALALRRRGEVMATYAGGRPPKAAALRRGWIAYPDYWGRTDKWATHAAPENLIAEAKEAACPV